jgi:hypothetical protein
MTVKVYSVDKIEFDSHSEAGKTRVLVEGQVNTGGWTNISLVPTLPDPKDMYVDLDLVGTKPTGPVTQAFENVKASLLIDKGASLGVTVHASTNSLKKDF